MAYKKISRGWKLQDQSRKSRVMIQIISDNIQSDFNLFNLLALFSKSMGHCVKIIDGIQLVFNLLNHFCACCCIVNVNLLKTVHFSLLWKMSSVIEDKQNVSLLFGDLKSGVASRLRKDFLTYDCKRLMTMMAVLNDEQIEMRLIPSSSKKLYPILMALLFWNLKKQAYFLKNSREMT